MKNIAIIEVYPNKNSRHSLKNAIDAHLRNALRLQYLINQCFDFDCDLLLDEADFVKAILTSKKYDCFILAYASGYAPFSLIKKLIEKNSLAIKIVLVNEYNNVYYISGFRNSYIIQNFENLIENKNVIRSFFANLNVLLFSDNFLIQKNVQKKYDCVYYGTYRKNREKYFVEYLKNNIYLSTSSKNIKKYDNLGCTPKYIKKLSWEESKETLKLFKYSLYIEDEYTHNVYNCLANRFYEAVFCKTVVFFDINCKNTVEKSALNIDDFFYVNSYKELMNKINNSCYEVLYKKQKYFEQKVIDDKKYWESSILDIIKNIVMRKFN